MSFIQSWDIFHVSSVTLALFRVLAWDERGGAKGRNPLGTFRFFQKMGL